MKFVLQTADAAGDARNCFYPNRVEVGCAEDLQEAVKKDHVCGSYRKDYRSVGNFLGSDVLVMDCDNDHTEDQGEWITAEKLCPSRSPISPYSITAPLSCFCVLSYAAAACGMFL